MTKRKRKLTPAQKAHKKLMREKYEWVFLNGKQKRIRRAPTVDGMPVDEFIRRNAGPIGLLQNEMHEELNEWEQQQTHVELGCGQDAVRAQNSDDSLPF